MKIVLWILLAILILIGLYILFLGICALLVDPKKEYEHFSPFYFRVLNSATACSFVLARLRISSSGMEKVPWDQRFLLVGNHMSNFDPIITWYVFRRNNVAFISKVQNFKIFIFGRLIRRCGFMAIDRENAGAAYQTITRAADLLKQGEASIGIYPEGARNRTPEKGLLPFHNGVFKIAQMAKVPIVVVAIKGTENIHRNYPLRGTKIQVDVVDVIPAEEIAGKRTREIGERVAAALNADLQR